VDKFLLFSASSADPAFLSAHEVSAFFCAMGRISICIVTKLFNNKLRKKTFFPDVNANGCTYWAAENAVKIARKVRGQHVRANSSEAFD